jgi:hypothetical protein
MEAAIDYDPFYGPPLKKAAPPACSPSQGSVAAAAARVLRAAAGPHPAAPLPPNQVRVRPRPRVMRRCVSTCGHHRAVPNRQDPTALCPAAHPQVGILVTGAVLAAFWQRLASRMSLFEPIGMRVVLEAWLALWLAMLAGRAAYCRQQRAAAAAAATLPPPAGSSAAAKGPDGGAVATATAVAPGIRATKEEEGKHAGEGEEEQEQEEEDVCVQKRRAQAAQAAADAPARAAVSAALAGLLAAGGGVAAHAEAAAALHALAEAMLEWPQALDQLLLAGGVDAVSAVAAAAAGALAAPGGSDRGAAPALLQASWVLLQVAHGPPGARRALAAPAGVAALAAMLAAALGPPGGDAAADAAAPAHLDARAAVLRNAAHCALSLLEPAAPVAATAQQAAGPNARAVERAADVAAAAAALSAAGVLAALARLASFDGPAAAPAAALLAAGALAAAAAADGPVGSDALAALTSPPALRGAVFVLGQGLQWQAGARPAAAAPGAVRALELLSAALLRALHARPEPLLRALIEERLVGPLLAAAPRRAAQLLVANLVSSRGQAVLAAVEAEWAVDAPLALAQATAAPAHLKLPAVAAPASSTGGSERAAAPQAAAASGASALLERGSDDVYTDTLTARLLLMGSRLQELVWAAGDDWAAAAAAAAGGGGIVGDACAVPASGDAEGAAAEAVAALSRHLLSLDAELQRVQLVRGDSVADTESSSACSADAAAACNGHEQQPAHASHQARIAGLVVFRFGALEHRMPEAGFRRLRRASKLMHTVLRRPGGTGGGGDNGGAAVTAFRVPGFSDAENRWALAQMEAWVEAGGGASGGGPPHAPALAPRDAARLWVAADFWQVDELQVACEDALAAALAASGMACGGEAPPVGSFPELLGLALHLCAAHPASCRRLQRLAAAAFLSAGAPAPALLGGGGGGGGGGGEDAAAALISARDALLPGVRDELRDRLVALCVLNLGRPDADSPEEPVQ